LIDIFVFSYPNSTKIGGRKKGVDIWKKIREDLDIGYTLIGNFQDLNHSRVDYDKNDLESRREQILQWKQDFLLHAAEFNYGEFVVSSASFDSFFDRDSSDLSKLFWGTTTFRPKISLSGLQNIAGLQYSMNLYTQTHFSRAVLNYTNIYLEPTASNFHELRKLTRSILAVYDLFPQVLESKDACISEVKVFREVVGRVGKLNDQIIAYEYYTGHNQIEKRRKVAEKLDKDWPKQQKWMKEKNLFQQFQCFLNKSFYKI
jgi:hypothetical protein